MKPTFPTETVKEGAVKLLVPRLGIKEKAPSKAPVFYNPRMKLNRDIAVIVLKTFQEAADRKLSVTEPMAGCGVRGLRFAAEVENIEKVVINDLNPEAVKLAELNVKRNRLQGKVCVEKMDANTFLSLHSSPKERFDFVDIDPFGSPAPFIDSAIRAVRDRGLIALTATDMAPLCGVHPAACIRKYSGRPLRTEYCHELAVRLLTGCLVLQSAKHDFGVKILFSHSTDHYIRVYAQLRRGAEEANKSVEEMGYILHCFHCLHRESVYGIAATLDTKCRECERRLSVAGPLWLGEILSGRFLSKMLKAARSENDRDRRLTRLLNMASAEVDAPPTYYVVDRISDKLGSPAPPKSDVIQRLLNLGYRAVPTHFNSRGVKTDAPAKIVKEAVLGAAETKQTTEKAPRCFK